MANRINMDAEFHEEHAEREAAWATADTWFRECTAEEIDEMTKALEHDRGSYLKMLGRLVLLELDWRHRMAMPRVGDGDDGE